MEESSRTRQAPVRAMMASRVGVRRLLLLLVLAGFPAWGQDGLARGQTGEVAPQAPVLPARAADAPDASQTTVGRRVEAEAGELCRVCKRPVDKNDPVYLVRGQRVPIHRAEVEHDLRAQIERLLAQLEPRGAFIAARQNQIALSHTWFFAGLYVLLGLVFAALCAHRALHAGQNPVVWFWLGLGLNAFAYLLLLARPQRRIQAPSGVPGGLRKISATYAPEPCAGCGALNHPSAAACSGCGAPLESKVASEVARAGLRTV